MNYTIEIKRLSAISILAFAVFFSSCATMRNDDKRPTEGAACMTGYDSAKMGEKEALAGIILMSIGGGMVIGGSAPIAYEESHQTLKDDYTLPRAAGFAAITMLVIGSAAVITGIGVFTDGHVRVNGWNRHCVGATPAERYCLINEPLPLDPLPMEIRP